MQVNKHYKDSVFSSLFSNPDALRELYSAIEGVPLPPDISIDINTLSDILYMNQINDISFTIDNRLVVLIEHQSTINSNMPLRLLMYITHVYEKIIDRNRLYHSKIEKIPSPEFIVLYNGKEPYPNHNVLRLSDAFRNIEGLRESKAASLELVVQVYNINYGHNQELLKKSETLDGYSFFVEKVREYEKELPFEEAMKRAIKYCIEHNILKRFLERNSSEVFNMLLTEWNMDDAKIAWREEAREETQEEIARNALAEGASVEFVQKITGLDMETILELKN